MENDGNLTVLQIIPAKNGFIVQIMDSEDDDDYETRVFTDVDSLNNFIIKHYEQE